MSLNVGYIICLKIPLLFISNGYPIFIPIFMVYILLYCPFPLELNAFNIGLNYGISLTEGENLVKVPETCVLIIL